MACQVIHDTEAQTFQLYVYPHLLWFSIIIIYMYTQHKFMTDLSDERWLELPYIIQNM